MNYPRVGVGVIVRKRDKVLCCLRKGAHGEGTWGFPGGKLEMNELIEDCAIRETKEEAGIVIKNVRPATFTNDIFVSEQKHFVTVFVLADYDSGRVSVKEPEKCVLWKWFTWDNLPSPLFLPIQNLLKQDFRL